MKTEQTPGRLIFRFEITCVDVGPGKHWPKTNSSVKYSAESHFLLKVIDTDSEALYYPKYKTHEKVPSESKRRAVS
jgi:hypothetical protein